MKISENVLYNSPCLLHGRKSILYHDLQQQVETLAAWLQKKQITRLALCADNSPQWLVVDLACELAGTCLLPLPAFFSHTQIRHCLSQSGCQHILTDKVARLLSIVDRAPVIGDEPVTGFSLITIRGADNDAQIPEGTGKITFTSGSTGQPKGVCLAGQSQFMVACALQDAINIHDGGHLCLLPLSTLLENVAGAYTALLSGRDVFLPSAEMMGFNGTRANVTRLLEVIDDYRPATLILVPELLRLLVEACQQGWCPPSSLLFMAVGGGKVSTRLLQSAVAARLPVFEGYGLSECCSVVSLNTAEQALAGSVGQVLPHQHVDIINQEIHVSGNTFLGYLNEPQSWYAKRVATGDLGAVDDAGFLHIAGRRKNLLISSFGRNINPEWVESEILVSPLIQQAVVVGDKQPFCSALIYAADSTSNAALRQWIKQVNLRLPDYARIQRWRRLPARMNVADGLYTENGRPRRHAITRHYAAMIAEMYADKPEESVNNNEVVHYEFL